MTAPANAMHSLGEIRNTLDDDLKTVDELICKELLSEIPLIRSITQHIIKSGGKRLRPLLLMLSAYACGYCGDEHVELAAVIEFIHTATLLHDDVVDHSALRRGTKTANAIWGNQASVLVGDFLYSKAFQIMAQRNNIPVMKLLSQTTNMISEGEVIQLMNVRNAKTTEREYFHTIHHKTAALFSAATEIGAILGSGPNNQATRKALASYGENLGIAFQIIDDVLDYTARPEHMGKNLGDDLAEGKLTLPLIYAMTQSQADTAEQLCVIIEEGGRRNLTTVLNAIEATNAIEHCHAQARKYAQSAQNAILHLPHNPHRKNLIDLADFAVQRTC